MRHNPEVEAFVSESWRYAHEALKEVAEWLAPREAEEKTVVAMSISLDDSALYYVDVTVE